MFRHFGEDLNSRVLRLAEKLYSYGILLLHALDDKCDNRNLVRIFDEQESQQMKRLDRDKSRLGFLS